ncbi:MAG TPA: rRNA methyltransferase, partial [Planctomycetes bacterium]|nr:rRNA methyltransferase [Planctomycetota bacterium]
KAVLREVVGYDLHRGCVACAPRPAELPLPLGELAERGRLRILVAEGLSDPANIGALLRNARAFAADLVLLDPKGGDPLEPRAIRAAVGNTFVVPWRRVDLPRALSELRAALPGLELLAATVGPKATPLHARSLNQLSPPARLAVLVGNEGAGLSAELLDLADGEVTIPIDPAADSLNVAAASALLLYALG